jgi:DNA-binding transcriptional ArsR family regulator
MVNNGSRALARPIRRDIVERLAGGPAAVGEATAGFGVSKPAISKHLKRLSLDPTVRPSCGCRQRVLSEAYVRSR